MKYHDGRDGNQAKTRGYFTREPEYCHYAIPENRAEDREKPRKISRIRAWGDRAEISPPQTLANVIFRPRRTYPFRFGALFPPQPALHLGCISGPGRHLFREGHSQPGTPCAVISSHLPARGPPASRRGATQRSSLHAAHAARPTVSARWRPGHSSRPQPGETMARRARRQEPPHQTSRPGEARRPASPACSSPGFAAQASLFELPLGLDATAHG